MPTSHIIRDLWDKFQPLQLNTQIIIIKGMRRSGKSTFIQYIRSIQTSSHFYFNFDDDRLVHFTIEDFQMLLETFMELFGPAKIVFFDEIQNIQGWEKFVRRLHDLNYKIYITGSNANLLSQELGTHLTGRYIALELYPYSFKEYLKPYADTVDISRIYTTEERAHIKYLFNRYYLIGGIPDYVTFEQPEYLADLYDSILYRDIIVRYHIIKTLAFKTLVYYLASNIGKDMSFNSLRKLLKLSNASTVADYCDYLEASYLCFFIPQYSHSLKEQTHKECDFIIKKDQHIIQAIQVTTHLDAPETEQREFDGLFEAMSCYHLKTGLILTEDHEEQRGNITIMPIWKWLLELNQQPAI